MLKNYPDDYVESYKQWLKDTNQLNMSNETLVSYHIFKKNPDHFESYKQWLKDTNESNMSNQTFLKYYEQMSAAHESGHALEAFLTNPAAWYLKLAIQSDGSKDKIMSDRTAFGYAISSKHLIHELFPASFKNDIKTTLAGAVGAMVVQGKKLEFKDFLATKIYGVGGREISDTDLRKAYKNADTYLNRIHHSTGSWIPENYTESEREQAIEKFLKECYEETYNDLHAHKKELQSLTDALYKKKVLYVDDIYTLASGKKQNFLGLMSSNKQWKKYLTDIAAHESKKVIDLHEKSPYEMHTVFG